MKSGYERGYQICKYTFLSMKRVMGMFECMSKNFQYLQVSFLWVGKSQLKNCLRTVCLQLLRVQCCSNQRGHHMCKQCLHTSRENSMSRDNNRIFIRFLLLFRESITLFDLVNQLTSLFFLSNIPPIDYMYGSKGSDDRKNKKRHNFTLEN